jgi:hypothetical protein
MAAAKPYDPIVSIEGMYHGSVTRIAYALKDPGNFGQSTKGIIQECSKQFHDALDDCEVQILDAKWYLEHQLQLRKEQRAAKAREERAASAKRKHDQVQADAEKDKEAKRQKIESPPEAQPEPEKPVTIEQPPAPEPTKPATPEKQATPPRPIKQDEKEKKPPTPPKQDPTPEKPPETDDLFGSGRPTPSADPGTVGGTLDGNDDFISGNFESMFGEPTGEEGNINIESDFAFDQPIGEDAFANNADNATLDQNMQSGEGPDLDSLLPGLGSYANQDPAAGNGQGLNTSNDLGAQANAPNSNDFDLPTLGGPNEFDAFLDANNFDGMDLGNDPNMDGDINNMDVPLDFDSMFS